MAQQIEPINGISDFNNHSSDCYGLTKREYFAALAMQGLLANHQTTAYHEHVPINAVTLADELIKALKK